MKTKDNLKRQNTKDILPEYDFSVGVRGKYAKKYLHNNNIVVIERDFAKYFGDSQSVNEDLRTLLKIRKGSSKVA